MYALSVLCMFIVYIYCMQHVQINALMYPLHTCIGMFVLVNLCVYYYIGQYVFIGGYTHMHPCTNKCKYVSPAYLYLTCMFVLVNLCVYITTLGIRIHWWIHTHICTRVMYCTYICIGRDKCEMCMRFLHTARKCIAPLPTCTCTPADLDGGSKEVDVPGEYLCSWGYSCTVTRRGQEIRQH